MSEWRQQKVFVSGGAGVIGTALVNELVRLGAEVFVGDLKPKHKEWADLNRYRQGDLITLKSKEVEEFSPEVYFHLAATFERSLETYEFWEENFHHNIALSHHLMTLFKDLPSLKKIVFSSSYLIYDPALYLFPYAQKQAISLSENASIAPRNLCGMSKLLHENELQFIKHFCPHLQIISARIFRSYGKNSRDIISRWIRALLANEPIVVYRPEGSFDFIYAEDVASGLLRLAETSFNGIVNLGSGTSRAIDDVLSILRQHFGQFPYHREVVDIPYEASQSDMALFHRLVNPFHFRSLEEVIPELIAYERGVKKVIA